MSRPLRHGYRHGLTAQLEFSDKIPQWLEVNDAVDLGRMSPNPFDACAPPASPRFLKSSVSITVPQVTSSFILSRNRGVAERSLNSPSVTASLRDNRNVSCPSAFKIPTSSNPVVAERAFDHITKGLAIPFEHRDVELQRSAAQVLFYPDEKLLKLVVDGLTDTRWTSSWAS